jgi:hypothetical protein
VPPDAPRAFRLRTRRARSRLIAAGLVLQLLPTRFELGIAKREVEPGSDRRLRDALSKDFVSVDTKAGAVPLTCKPQERCNHFLRRFRGERQPLAVIPDGASWNSVRDDLGRNAASE